MLVNNDILPTIRMQATVAASVATASNYWQNYNGAWSYQIGGNKATGWNSIDDAWYFFNSDGKMQTGWLNNNAWFYLQNSGRMQTGWGNINNNWYLFNNSGQMQTGWQRPDNSWYLLSASGAMTTGWQLQNNNWYHLENNGQLDTDWFSTPSGWYLANDSGQMQTGWQAKNGKWYHFDDSGLMKTGWEPTGNSYYHLSDSGALDTSWFNTPYGWYFANGSGVMQTGWQVINGKWYDLGDSGLMKTGWEPTGNSYYHLSDSGALDTSWFNTPYGWYFANGSGVMQTGWQVINGKWYDLGDSGLMKTGWEQNGDKYYHLNNSGALDTNWFATPYGWYFADNSGVMQTGWQNINSKWYLLGSDGSMKTDWQFDNNNWYHFDQSGAMQTWWFEANNAWYFSNGSGVMQKGLLDSNGHQFYLDDNSGAMHTSSWTYVNNQPYYFDENGYMVKNNVKNIKNSLYGFDNDGHLLHGWQTVNNSPYFFNDNGAAQMGWINYNGNKYYMTNAGVMKNWFQENGSWYYGNPNDGALRYGWINYNNGVFYTNSNGVMLTGIQSIDDKRYRFNEAGQMWQGWYQLDGNLYNWYYSDPNTGIIQPSGPANISGYDYNFGQDGLAIRDMSPYFDAFIQQVKKSQTPTSFIMSLITDVHFQTNSRSWENGSNGTPDTRTQLTLTNLDNQTKLADALNVAYKLSLGDAVNGTATSKANQLADLDEFASKFMQVQDGTKAFMLPGNHDLNHQSDDKYNNTNEGLTANDEYEHILKPSDQYGVNDPNTTPALDTLRKNIETEHGSRLYYDQSRKVVSLFINDFDDTRALKDGKLAVDIQSYGGVSAAQINWIVQELQHVPDDYHVMFFMHSSLPGVFNGEVNTVPSDDDMWGIYNGTLLRSVIEAFQNGTLQKQEDGTTKDVPLHLDSKQDSALNFSLSNPNVTNSYPYTDPTFYTVNPTDVSFSGATGRVVAVINGHWHKDNESTQNNVLYVETNSAFPDTSNGYGARPVDSLQEGAQDFITVDIPNHKITFSRFGEGDGKARFMTRAYNFGIGATNNPSN